MGQEKDYRPVPVPPRGGDRACAPSGQPPVPLRSVGAVQPAFADIDLSPPRVHAPPPAPRAQAVQPAADEKRALFYAMRKVGGGDFPPQTDHAKRFYEQGLFMRDFEDDYDGQDPFSAYFPCYHLMSYGQLRTYFTWRARVRRGDITRLPVSYAFLYIYELLGNIGVMDPRDGLERLVTFWKAFRGYDTLIDHYVLQWIKDYHVYYPVECSFGEFAAAHGLRAFYPTVFGYDSGPEDSFALFSGISKYDVEKSAFYGEETAPVMQSCFYEILCRLRGLFSAQGALFEDLVFFPASGESLWTPFGSALFYPSLRQPDRQVSLSVQETYACRRDTWTYRTPILASRGQHLIGYILKQMEAELRKAMGYKHKLYANPDMCGGETRGRLEEMGISLSALIEREVAAFYARLTRTVVSVDAGQLARIRREALHTQEKLLLPEETGETPPPESAGQAPGGLGTSECPETTTPAGENGRAAAFEAEETSGGSSSSSVWAALRDRLTPTERDALRLCLQGRSLGRFALQNAVMPEVLVDGINQKAMDCIGDAVLELGDAVTVYEEYREKLEEMVNG